jgi:hypothetical protein
MQRSIVTRNTISGDHGPSFPVKSELRLRQTLLSQDCIRSILYRNDFAFPSKTHPLHEKSHRSTIAKCYDAKAMRHWNVEKVAAGKAAANEPSEITVVQLSTTIKSRSRSNCHRSENGNTEESTTHVIIAAKANIEAHSCSFLVKIIQRQQLNFASW